MRPLDLHRVRLPGVVPGHADVGDGSVHIGKIPRTYALFFGEALTPHPAAIREPTRRSILQYLPIVGDAGIVFFRTKPEYPTGAFKRKVMSGKQTSTLGSNLILPPEFLGQNYERYTKLYREIYNIQ